MADAKVVYFEPGMAYIPVVDGKLVEADDLNNTAGEGKTPQAPAGNQSGVKYIYVSQGNSASYLVRSDGQLDRTTGGGKITSRHICNEPGVTYVGVAAGIHATYAIRSDGKIDRFTSAKSVTEGITCPDADVKFISGSCSEQNSYLLGSNGAIYRFRSANDISRMETPAGATYVAVSGGLNTSYFVRSDGKIDYSRGSGTIAGTVEPVEGQMLIGVSQQLVIPRGPKGEDYSNQANYFVRGDGALARTKGSGKIGHKVSPPSGLKYLAAAAGCDCSYYVRSDGAVDRTTGSDGSVSSTMNPPPGTRYVMAAIGSNYSYLLRSDGIVDRCRGGKVSKSMVPSNEEIAGSSCSIM